MGSIGGGLLFPLPLLNNLGPEENPCACFANLASGQLGPVAIPLLSRPPLPRSVERWGGAGRELKDARLWVITATRNLAYASALFRDSARGERSGAELPRCRPQEECPAQHLKKYASLRFLLRRKPPTPSPPLPRR